MPVTIPEAEPTLATVLLLLLHIPPATLLARVMVWPIHTLDAPVMAAVAFTLIAAEVTQPDAVVYEIVAAPAEMPVTTPEAEPTVAMLPSLLLHTPPPMALLSPVV